jgi:FkbM family methyltransferase
MRQLIKRVYGAIPLKRQLFSLVRGRLPVPQRLYQHLHFEGPFTVAIDEDRRFRIHSYGDLVENEIFWSGYGGSWEGSSLRVWDHLCRDGNGVILDIGANTGVYALAAASLAPQAQVVAFEPLARMAKRLRNNVELNRARIRVEEKAVSERSGILPIFDDQDDASYGASLEQEAGGGRSYDVAVTSIDEYLEGNTRVHAIKIDVERHEPAAMRGMVRTLARSRPPVLIEILDERIGAEVTAVVSDLGYRIFHIVEGRGLLPTQVMQPVGDHNWNHLLCTEEDFQHRGLQRLLAS